jgi:hypothetical protein
VASTILAVTALGIVNSAAFNLTLGRQGYVAESWGEWFRWGVKSLVAPGLLAAVLLLSIAIAQPLAAFIGRRWLGSVTTHLGALGRRSGLQESRVIAQTVATAGILALAGTSWRFFDLISAFMTSDISTADASAFVLLSPSHYLEHRYYRTTFTVLVLMLGTALVLILRRRRGAPPARDRGGIVALSTVLGLAVLLLDLPYRLLYQTDRFEKVRVGSDACYILGERGPRLLLHCPSSPVPRNRTIAVDDPRLERLNCYGSVFDASPACEAPR